MMFSLKTSVPSSFVKDTSEKHGSTKNYTEIFDNNVKLCKMANTTLPFIM